MAKILAGIRKRKKRIIVLSIILVIGAGVFMIVRNILSSPAEGTVLHTATTSSSGQQTSKKLGNDYLDMEYPAVYDKIPNPGKSSADTIQTWTIKVKPDKGQGPSRTVSIVLQKMPAGGIKEDGAYKLYSGRPDLYSLGLTPYNRVILEAKRTNPSYEHILLWPHNQYLLKISLSTAKQTEDVDRELEAIASSVNWKQ